MSLSYFLLIFILGCLFFFFLLTYGNTLYMLDINLKSSVAKYFFQSVGILLGRKLKHMQFYIVKLVKFFVCSGFFFVRKTVFLNSTL